MKNKFRPIKTLTIGVFGLTIICCLIFYLSACSNTTVDVMSSYDERFPVKTDSGDDEYKPGIDEVGFDPATMLDDEYFKSTDGTLQLRGPKGGLFFEWTLSLQETVSLDGATYYPKKSVMPLPVNCYQNGSSDKSEYFIVYIPLSGLKPGSYVIRLRAKGKGGTWYSDEAALIIYDVIRPSGE